MFSIATELFATQFSGKIISLELMFSWPGPLNFGVFVLICSYSKFLQEEKELKKSLLYQALACVLSLISSHPLVVVQCPTLCDSMNGSTPGSSLLHCLLELAQIHGTLDATHKVPRNPGLPREEH